MTNEEIIKDIHEQEERLYDMLQYTLKLEGFIQDCAYDLKKISNNIRESFNKLECSENVENTISELMKLIEQMERI